MARLTFSIDNRASRLLLCAVALCAALCVVPVDLAHADVRKADVIAGSTVEARGYTVADCPFIDAQFAAVASPDGVVYFSRNADEKTQIASITKVMTAIVAVENAKEDTYVAVSEDAALIGESTAGLQEGDVMDFETALKALLVPSGNDAAVAIAETIGAQMIAADPSKGTDPMDAFVKAMNEKAKALGCENTLYENPHGLDDEGYEGDLHSTAADQAKVAACAMSYPKIRNIVSGGSTTIAVTRNGSKERIDLETTDGLLDIYEHAIGIKTGFTNLAGASFMGAANKDGVELYAIVLDSADEWQRFYDAKTLFEWVYDHVHDVPLANTKESMSMKVAGSQREVPVVARVSHLDWIDKTVAATLSAPDEIVTVFDLDGNVSQSFEFDELRGSIRSGQKIGRVKYWQRNVVIATQDLIACEDVAAPGVFDSISIWWNRLVGGFSSAPETAESQVYNVMPIINSNVTPAA